MRKRIVFLVVFSLALIATGCGKEKTDDVLSTEKGSTERINQTQDQTAKEEQTTAAEEETTGQDAEEENLMENGASEGVQDKIPGKDNLNVEDIAGYQPQEGEEVSGLTLPYHIENTNLEIGYIGKYTGDFVEDGSDEPTDNVASILVTNTGDRTVQYAKLTFKVNKKEEAVFELTNLPAGTSVLVEESSMRRFEEEDVYKYSDNLCAEIDNVSLQPDKVSLETKDNVITLENISKEELGTVYVYYKNLQSGGAYLGGITYRVKYENVKPGEKVEKETSHYKSSSSQIVMVDIIN